MGDVLTKEQRSYNMSKIRGKDTKPEIILRKELHNKGVRGYRIHYRLQGKPDIVFTKQKLAVFVDGCFWHKCPKCFKKPETRTDFWMNKISRNVERDKVITKKLKEDNWIVIRIWEHDIMENPEKIAGKIIKKKRGN